MAVDRRGFLTRLLSGVVGLSLIDVDRLLWVPGARTYFLPALPAANELLTIDVVTREALRILRNNLTFAKIINRDYALAADATRLGDTVNIRIPTRFLPVCGGRYDGRQKLSAVASVDRVVPVTMQHHLAINLDDRLFKMPLAKASGKYLEPAMAALTQHIIHHKMNVFGESPVPLGVAAGAICTDDAISLRGMVDYSLEDAMTVVRFDVLGGTFRAGDA